MSQNVIKVALYEDNLTLRTSLAHLLQSSEEFEFLGAYDSPIDILQHCENVLPDVILMDVDMPHMNGIEATKLVKDQFGNVNILILTVFESKIIEIIEAIHEIYNGGSPMTPAIARKVLEFFAQPKVVKNSENNLSERELDILKCLVNGDSYKMIASNCYISMGTVRSHINNIYKKLHVNSKSEAVVKALKDRLV
jgi:DNA-binding NarL/FixJ family response regulator